MTSLNEQIYIVGNTDELGNWKSLSHRMTWTDGHHWRSTIEVINRVEFKFVCFNTLTRHWRWERGNGMRVIDPYYSKEFNTEEYTWDHFKVVFKVNIPKRKKTELVYINLRQSLIPMKKLLDLDHLDLDNELWSVNVNIPMDIPLIYNYTIHDNIKKLSYPEFKLRRIHLAQGFSITNIEETFDKDGRKLL